LRKNERKNLTTLVKSARLFQRSLIQWLDTLVIFDLKPYFTIIELLVKIHPLKEASF